MALNNLAWLIVQRTGNAAEALPMIEDGRLRPTVDREVSLWEARAAHDALENRKVFGKVVLIVD